VRGKARAVFEATEDSMLVAESASWIEAIKHNPLDTISLEMLQETVRERNKYVSRRIDETLARAKRNIDSSHWGTSNFLELLVLKGYFSEGQ
jgi:hypothetical protein